MLLQWLEALLEEEEKACFRDIAPAKKDGKMGHAREMCQNKMKMHEKNISERTFLWTSSGKCCGQGTVRAKIYLTFLESPLQWMKTWIFTESDWFRVFSPIFDGPTRGEFLRPGELGVAPGWVFRLLNCVLRIAY